MSMSQREQAERACAEAGVEATDALVRAIIREIGLAENARSKYSAEDIFRDIAKLGEERRKQYEDVMSP